MKTRVAINGFGRIGRCVCRIMMNNPEIEIVAINDPSPKETLAHLFKYDSNYGIYDKDVICTEEGLLIGDHLVKCFGDRDPLNLPWKDLDIDVVVESTGHFTDREGAEKHIAAGAKRVLISAPGKNVDYTVVRGANCGRLAKEHVIVSNASCTTNCLAPFARVLNEKFGIKRGLMTTIHAYTNDQNILDVSHKDMRRARAAALSMIPTTTGAAKAIGEVLPELKGKMTGISIRVPTPTVSVVDLVAELEKPATAEEINAALKEYANGELKGILQYCELPLVSVDFKGNSHSSIIDALSTQVIDGNMVKILSWYDNEWGYSVRTVEVVEMMGRFLKS